VTIRTIEETTTRDPGIDPAPAGQSAPAGGAETVPETEPASAAEPAPATGSTPERVASDPTGLVEISGVHKSYGTREVLHVSTLLGPSGSGKSTLLRAINHLETIDGGSITIDGDFIGYERRGDRLHELPEKRVLQRRTRVGMVFQNFNLFPHLTALENIIEAPIGLKRAKRAEAIERARELLARVGLADHADHYPRQLSGGQQQRVAIARALALDPDVLLFDEPTSALDPELVGEVLSVIRDLAHSGTTLIIVTHEIGFAAEVADHVVFLDGGRVVEEGAPEKVLRSPEQARTQEFLDWVI
jgi:polar amino acid transport system ATP-binding protein